MPDFIPPGRLSSHKHAGKTIQVQTEYATRPHPRVTTSVVLDGRIVHKIDYSWDLGVETEELRKALESHLANQHRQSLEQVKARASEYVQGMADSGADCGATSAYPEPSYRDSMTEVLGSVPYVTGICEIDQTGAVIYSRDFRNIQTDLSREFQMFGSLISSFAEIIRVGEFRYGCCWFSADNVVLVNLRGRLFAIMTEPAGSIERIQHEFPELFEAVHD